MELERFVLEELPLHLFPAQIQHFDLVCHLNDKMITNQSKVFIKITGYTLYSTEIYRNIQNQSSFVGSCLLCGIERWLVLDWDCSDVDE